MSSAQQGDRIQVHYVIHSQDGSHVSSRGRSPLEVTAGVEHPRLRGLGRMNALLLDLDTLGLERAQTEDRWRDAGGEA